MPERYYTDFLTADCTFLLGAATVFSLSGTNFLYNRSGTEALADARAIRQDFALVGQDIRDAAAEQTVQEQKQLPLNL